MEDTINNDLIYLKTDKDKLAYLTSLKEIIDRKKHEIEMEMITKEEIEKYKKIIDRYPNKEKRRFYLDLMDNYSVLQYKSKNEPYYDTQIHKVVVIKNGDKTLNLILKYNKIYLKHKFFIHEKLYGEIASFNSIMEKYSFQRDKIDKMIKTLKMDTNVQSFMEFLLILCDARKF